MTITSSQLLTLGAWAAVLGGALRVATAFVPYTPETLWLEALYAFIDVLMLAATLAIAARYLSVLGVAGLLGAGCAGLGFASIIGPDPVMFGVDFYRLGAGVIVIAMAVLAVQLLRAGVLRLAAVLWLAALGFALGLAGLGTPGLLVASGTVFGLGFVAAGARLLQVG